jgi:hypothetical protein
LPLELTYGTVTKTAGNNGCPVVNDSGQLVAVMIGDDTADTSRIVSCIDRSEVQAVLDDFQRRN